MGTITVRYTDNLGSNDSLTEYESKEAAMKAIDEKLELAKRELFDGKRYDYGDFGSKTEIWEVDGYIHCSWEILEWFCTDSDSLQYCKEHGNGKYSFVEIIWLDTVEGDPGYPDKEYTVKSAYIDLDDYDTHDKECAICGYYDSLDAVYTEYEDAADQLLHME